jgi:LTXXQ motif family protein
MKSLIRFRLGLIVLAMVALWGLQSQRAVAQVPDENRKELVGALGTQFIVFRDKVLDELKVSEELKEKLLQHVMEQIMETGPFLDSLAKTGEEREKKLSEHRKKAEEKLAKVLKETLNADQLTRLRQIELQQERGFALGQAELVKELKITDQQRKQFVAITQEFQKKVQPLIKEAQSGGKPEEIRPKVLEMRDETAKKLEAVLTDEQKEKWKGMLGEPFDLGDH